MSVEIHEEAMMASPNCNSSSSVSNDQCSAGTAKGKRTKRQRQLLQSSSSASSYSGEYSGSTTEEEEDMANCLILLAQGRALGAQGPKPRPAPEEEAVDVGGWGERFTSRRPAPVAATATNGKVVGFYVYECKTCSKCFPSFQALGGHRASHKKPKTAAPVAAVMATEENKPAREDAPPIRGIAPQPAAIPGVVLIPNHAGGKAAEPAPVSTHSTAAGNNKPRVHECSICGSEFSSGQALGGHMRRHRTAAAAAVPEPPPEAKKEQNIRYCLDLNLPAPMEDVERAGDLPKAAPPFPSFSAAKRTLIFSASTPLVDCHY